MFVFIYGINTFNIFLSVFYIVLLFDGSKLHLNTFSRCLEIKMFVKYMYLLN